MDLQERMARCAPLTKTERRASLFEGEAADIDGRELLQNEEQRRGRVRSLQ